MADGQYLVGKRYVHVTRIFYYNVTYTLIVTCLDIFVNKISTQGLPATLISVVYALWAMRARLQTNAGVARNPDDANFWRYQGLNANKRQTPE